MSKIKNPLLNRIKEVAIERFADSERYKFRFKINSAIPNHFHFISFDTTEGYWTCSCNKYAHHGQCHHLTMINLKGRAYGRQSLNSYIKGIA